VIPGVSGDHSNEFGYFKVLAGGADLRLPSNLNHGSSPVDRLIRIPGGSVSGHGVQIGIRQVLTHEPREIL
jgi:arginase family enzyme